MSGKEIWRYILPACALIAGGCAKSAVSQLRTGTPAEAAAKVLELYDSNKDGKLAPDELKASPALAAGVSKIDKNRDGSIDAAEMQARFERHDQMADLVAFDVEVSANRRPLEGATVTFIPEPFMGEGKQSYVGVTSSTGAANLEGQQLELPALPTGYYTVHIVHPPSQTDVKRGTEVADDTPSPNRLAFDTQLAAAPLSRGR